MGQGRPGLAAWALATWTLAAWPMPAPASQGQPNADEPSRQEPPAPARAAKRPAALTPADRERLARLERESLEALMRGDYELSEQRLREQLEIDPESFVVLYNLACIRAVRRDPEGGDGFFARAVECGFIDARQVTRDPQLRPLRDQPRFKAITGDWPGAIVRHLERNLERTRAEFKRSKTVAMDDGLRLAYVSGFDGPGLDGPREELALLARWADHAVMPGILDQKELEKDAWVVVALPERAEYQRWAARMFGPGVSSGFSTIGGHYDHDRRRLVAQDLGATLRHEFFHVLHWRSMNRLGQTHPTWVMEGLCSLVEDYDVAGGDRTDAKALRPAPSWRTNTVKRMLDAGVLVPLDQLLRKSGAEFVGERRMGLYAQARTVFLYLFERGRLAPWYAEYTASFAADPSGAKALEAVFARSLADIDDDFRAFVRALPTVPEELKRGMASLGLEVDAGLGDGPVVVSGKRGPGPALDIGPGDVILSIDSRPTRDLPELLRVLGTYKPGEVVEVAYRRVKLYKSERVTLIEFVPR